MILNVDYFDNNIIFYDECINVIEIENKQYFLRLINDLNSLLNEGISEDIHFINNNEEINMNNKIVMYIDLFNIEINNKKIIGNLYKKITENISELNREKINKNIFKIKNDLIKSVEDFDFELNINNDVSIDDILKMFKISIKEKDNILDNILLIMEINNYFNLNLILVFVNLKLYLNESEIEEIYKYSIYNKQRILLIDSISYGVSKKYEKKILIDNDLIEYML